MFSSPTQFPFRVLNSMSGLISSWNYPMDFAVNTECPQQTTMSSRNGISADPMLFS